jgi:multiple antibiotic resistance protein
MDFDYKQIITITLALFAIIDVIGSIPAIISSVGSNVESGKVTIASGVIMIFFLFLGKGMLNFIGLNVAAFAVAGALVIFILGLEMILGVNIFKPRPETSASSIVPIAFPLIAGSGTLTTLLSFRANYFIGNILIAILINLVIIYFVLRYIPYIERKLGKNGLDVLRKVFGILLLAVAVQLFTKNISMLF